MDDDTRRFKYSRQLECDINLPDEEIQRSCKVKRVEPDVPIAEVDIKLAEKLDSILKLDGPSKPKFLTNKPKTADKVQVSELHKGSEPSLMRRNLTREEIKERVTRKYDTLVPELDPNRPRVRVVKILSARESIELGKDQAHKQMERQLELNSVSGNQSAQKSLFERFRFKDGCEVKARHSQREISSSRVLKAPESKLTGESECSKSSKSIRFADESLSSSDQDNYHEAEDSCSDSSSSEYDSDFKDAR